MDKERWSSIIRYILTALGAYLIGRNLGGIDVTPEFWEQAIGAVLVVFSTVWGFMDKTIREEAFQGALRQVFAFVGSLAVVKGWLSAQTFLMISGLIGTLGTYIYSWLSRKKSLKLANGEIQPRMLSGVRKHAA
jgi:CDP-diglyceride synthetase